MGAASGDVTAAARPLAVAQLVEALEMGGAERLAVQIANARAAAGDASHLIVMSGPGPLSGAVDPRVALRHLGFARASVRDPLRFALSLRRGERLLSRRIAADGVQVVQSHLPGANFWGLLLALRGRCAVIATVHNNREFDYGDADHPLRSRLRRAAYRQMLRRCAAVVAVSEAVAASCWRTWARDRAEAGAPGRGAQRRGRTRPLDAAARAAIRARFGAAPGDLLVMAAGRHCEQKNFAALIEAAERLRAIGLPFRLVIAGDGPLRPDHEALRERLGLGDAVQLPGNVADFARVLQAADVFALPSLWEGLPLVLLEALAAGVPVVGSDIAGVRDVIVDDRSGLLVTPGDPEGLAAAIALLADPVRRERLRAGGLALVRERYSFARVSHPGRIVAARRTAPPSSPKDRHDLPRRRRLLPEHLAPDRRPRAGPRASA
jgi:glycosyltransferase involved in cell wall biosynthesis